MKHNLEKLLYAQEFDLEIDKLIKSKKVYPGQIESWKKEIDDLKNAIDDIKGLIVENQKNRRLIEEEITAEQDALSNKKQRLLKTKTNKEYTAVQNEIEQALERIDHLETEDLELMTVFDELNPQKDELIAKHKATRSENDSKIKEIHGKFDSIESDISKLEKKRKRMLSGMEDKAMRVYNRLRKGKSGIAIATVNQIKLSCQGCFKQLPPQKVLEVRRSEKLLFCESCGRLLVWDERAKKK
ncbi:MAG: hypothetical protein HOC71_08180 [Candidatus Latescibacteria bacterium]|jgi:uncharacterized protein|nr:hypothetical protein [Candidatus Latescibacterota bacterium]